MFCVQCCFDKLWNSCNILYTVTTCKRSVHFLMGKFSDKRDVCFFRSLGGSSTAKTWSHWSRSGTGFYRIMDLGKIWQFPNQQLQKCFIELDDGKIYRKALYLMVKTMVSGVDFPLNQSIECLEESLFNEWRPVDHQITKDQSTYFPFSSCVSLNPSTDRMVISLYHYMSIHMNIYKCMLDLIKKKNIYIASVSVVLFWPSNSV